MEMVNNREALELTFKMINAETQLCYSSDYPHWDTDLPSTIYDLPFLTEQAKRNILGGNALRLFNLEPDSWPIGSLSAAPSGRLRNRPRRLSARPFRDSAAAARVKLLALHAENSNEAKLPVNRTHM